MPDYGFRWNRLECRGSPIDLNITLTSGQSFRWRQSADGAWWGAIGSVGFALRQEPDRPESPLYWQSFPESDRIELLTDYFQLRVDLESLSDAWAEAEPAITPCLRAFRGLRILRQPPDECFFAFQCASCNTVTKIERSVHRLGARYGAPVETGLACPPFPIYAFPAAEALARADEKLLREDLWGYRAPRVIALARSLCMLPPDWLLVMRGIPYPAAKTALTSLHGIGAKLADCICLFALDKHEAIPVDTHVRQLACRLFRTDLEGRSLTPWLYSEIAAEFGRRFGPYAGWAHQYLFLGELHRHRERVTGGRPQS